MSEQAKPITIAAPMQAQLVRFVVAPEETVSAGQEVAIVEAMKMQHAVTAPKDGVVATLMVEPGAVVEQGQALMRLVPGAAGTSAQAARVEKATDPDHIREDLATLHARLALTEDAARADAMAKRHARGHRSARENVEDLCDAGSFTEYGQLVVAAQRTRRELDDLMRNTPADGIVTGVGSVNGDLFDAETARTAVLAYDYTVLAGTQGAFNHKKTDRVLELAHEWALPIVFYTEGGGRATRRHRPRQDASRDA